MKNYIIRKLSFAVNLFGYFVLSRVIVNGKILRIPRIYKIDLGDFLSEKWVNEVIKKILSVRKGAFIDVGFNLGQTLIKVKTTDINRRYYGFEPNPACYYYADELVKVNKFEKCTLIPVGLSNKTDAVTLFARNRTDGSASLIAGFKEVNFRPQKTVVVLNGDYLFSRLGIDSISVIKVDVEGAESEVLDGLKDSLLKFRPYILCEILPVYDKNSEIGRLRKEKQKNLLRTLKDLRYQIYRIMRNGKIVLLDTIGIHSDMSLRDYLFIPEEEKNEAARLLSII